LDKIITVPFGYLLDWLYQFTDNYGLALIFFAVIVQLVMAPMSAMSKKSTMKMSRLQPKIQEIQRKYADDQQKQNEAIRELQQQEGARIMLTISMTIAMGLAAFLAAGAAAMGSAELRSAPQPEQNTA